MATLSEQTAKEAADGIPRGSEVDVWQNPVRPDFAAPVPVVIYHRPMPADGSGLADLLAVELRQWDSSDPEPFGRMVRIGGTVLKVGFGVHPTAGLTVTVIRPDGGRGWACDVTEQKTRPCGCGCGQFGVILMMPADAAALFEYCRLVGWLGHLPFTPADVEREAFAGLADTIVEAQAVAGGAPHAD